MKPSHVIFGVLVSVILAAWLVVSGQVWRQPYVDLDGNYYQTRPK